MACRSAAPPSMTASLSEIEPSAKSKRVLKDRLIADAIGSLVDDPTA
jgi:hypothetical protein